MASIPPPYYHAAATIPIANHGNFFNTRSLLLSKPLVHENQKFGPCRFWLAHSLNTLMGKAIASGPKVTLRARRTRSKVASVEFFRSIHTNSALLHGPPDRLGSISHRCEGPKTGSSSGLLILRLLFFVNLRCDARRVKRTWRPRHYADEGRRVHEDTKVN
jgi:hypothetical protein